LSPSRPTRSPESGRRGGVQPARQEAIGDGFGLDGFQHRQWSVVDRQVLEQVGPERGSE
jgi:hypothetical protein